MAQLERQAFQAGPCPCLGRMRMNPEPNRVTPVSGYNPAWFPEPPTCSPVKELAGVPVRG